MRHHVLSGILVSSLVLSLGIHQANAQAMLADDIIILSKGQRAQEKARTTSHLGPSPGAGERPFRLNPGAGEARLGEQPGAAAFPTRMQERDVLSATSAEGRAVGRAPAARIMPPARLPSQRMPIYGALEVPEGYDEGPPQGLTLDMAIQRLAQSV
jgi:hypothetical protein